MSDAPIRPPPAVISGDRVRCLRSPTHRAIHIGAEGTVTVADELDEYVRVDFDGYDFEHDTLVAKQDLEALPPIPPLSPEEQEAIRKANAASIEEWRAKWVNDGSSLKSLKDTWWLQFQTDVPELPPGQRVELLRFLGSLIRPFAPIAADHLEAAE